MKNRIVPTRRVLFGVWQVDWVCLAEFARRGWNDDARSPFDDRLSQGFDWTGHG
jgi:hypothetical protein